MFKPLSNLSRTLKIVGHYSNLGMSESFSITKFLNNKERVYPTKLHAMKEKNLLIKCIQ